MDALRPSFSRASAVHTSFHRHGIPCACVAKVHPHQVKTATASSSASPLQAGVTETMDMLLHTRSFGIPLEPTTAHISGNDENHTPVPTPTPSPAQTNDVSQQPTDASHHVVATSSYPSLASGSLDEVPEVTKKVKGPWNLIKRVVTGIALGGLGAGFILAGSWPFLGLILFVTYHATQEYYGMLTSKGMSRGMTPPPPLVSSLTTVMCVSMGIFSFLHRGRSSTILAVCAFALLVMEIITLKRPRFSQLATSVFGLFYCGWLPSFWVKLRLLGKAAPASSIGTLASGVGLTWSVGLCATWTVVCCIIAADTCAYLVGKTLGRTKLTDISPKKTVEGAAGGLAGSIGLAAALQHFLGWPYSMPAAVGLGALTFLASLFGDLIESIMKREAGMKDSGNLIPGHGGLLDRFDSYMFTGAVAYFYIVFVLPVVQFAV